MPFEENIILTLNLKEYLLLNPIRGLTVASFMIVFVLLPTVTVPVESKQPTDILLFDNFSHGDPRSQQSSGNIEPSTWSGMSLWTLNNVNGSTVWFPSGRIATFSSFFTNFIYSPYGVSITSKGNWTVQSRLVLLVHIRALNYTRGQSTWYGPNGGADAWRADLSWGSAGSANIGYGTDSVHNPNTGLTVGGECIERTPQGVLTTNNLLGQWITANITLSAPTQTIYFSAYDSNGNTFGHTSTTGSCGTMFGSLPVHIHFWTYFGTSDIDWIRLTS